MVGLIKNSEKVPFITLEQFIDTNKLTEALNEIEEYRLKQENEGADVIVGYKHDDWNSQEFLIKSVNALPKTTEYVMSFCDIQVPFNIIWTPSDNNFLLLHQDLAPFSCSPWESLIPDYKDTLTNSYRELLVNQTDFQLVDDIANVNPIYNGLDFDYDAFLLKDENYEDKVKETYKLHLILSNTKTLFVYDNVADTIHHFDSKAAVFNARDHHDSLLSSWGYSIQFPMTPYFLKSEIITHCELPQNPLL